jgi:hypothetical protein
MEGDGGSKVLDRAGERVGELGEPGHRHLLFMF